MGQACLLAVMLRKPRAADSLIVLEAPPFQGDHSICTPPSATIGSWRLTP